MTDTVWWGVTDVARHIIGCHPHHLYYDLRDNRAAWEPFIKADTDRLLLNADAVADRVAENPYTFNWPVKRPGPWRPVKGKRRR